jgi:hypothetical protein
MPVTRRSLLHAGACCACSALSGNHGLFGAAAANAADRGFDGCSISPAVYHRFNSGRPAFSSVADGLFARNRHFRSTGDRTLDRDLDRALTVVADLFGVNPAFGFYDPSQFRGADDDPDSWIMNAWASAESTDIRGTWGTVGFGWDLFHKEFFEFDNSGTSIITIVAHEFAHTWQQKSGNIVRLREGHPRKSEINADFLAGYFLGTRKRANPILKFQKAGDLLQRLGRKSSGQPNRTHGDEMERLDAAEAGFRIAYVGKKDLNHALKAGLEYVSLS